MNPRTKNKPVNCKIWAAIGDAGKHRPSVIVLDWMETSQSIIDDIQEYSDYETWCFPVFKYNSTYLLDFKYSGTYLIEFDFYDYGEYRNFKYTPSS